jgi:phosphate butyryltransferase
MKHISELLEKARAMGKVRLAVAAAQEASVIEAVFEAWDKGIAEPVLIGDPALIAAAAASAYDGRGVDISNFELIPEKDVHQCALKAVELVRSGDAQVLMKGIIDTSILLKAALNKESGINMGRMASHIVLIEAQNYHKFLFLTDGALNIAPDLPVFVDIIENAVGVARKFGIEMPKVALLAALEKVNPDKMPCTGIEAILTQMNRRGQIRDCIVDGPLALDLAVSSKSAKIKHVVSEVAGDADILVVPTIEVGNILYKGLLDLAGAKGAAIIAGAAKPIVLTSRSDSAETKLASIAFAALTGRAN